MRMSDWSSDVCSSDLAGDRLPDPPGRVGAELVATAIFELVDRLHQADLALLNQVQELQAAVGVFLGAGDDEAQVRFHHLLLRSEEQTSELQSLMRISYAVFCLKKKNNKQANNTTST